MSMLPRLKPTTFYDLAVEVALGAPLAAAGAGQPHRPEAAEQLGADE